MIKVIIILMFLYSIIYNIKNESIESDMINNINMPIMVTGGV